MPHTLQRVVRTPTYHRQEVQRYVGNPFIEALNPIYSIEQFSEKCALHPVVKEEDKAKPQEIVSHIIRELNSSFIVMQQHFEIERLFSIAIRNGYTGRNPANYEDLRLLRDINRIELGSNNEATAAEQLLNTSETLHQSTPSFSVLGVSGMGKTTGVKRILSLYPQVVYHSSYNGQHLTRQQIVWLNVECPPDGSLRTLGMNILATVDGLIGTTYLRDFLRSKKSSVSQLLVEVCRINVIHGIGVIVFDEVQHLQDTKNGPTVMKFLVSLVNMGTPLALIGTPIALDSFDSYRSLRRGGKSGSVFWDRMKKGPEFLLFLKELWKYQWTRNFTPLTEELSEVMYECSQGITSEIVNLFMLAQEKALWTEKHIITANLIQKVRKEDMQMTKEPIEALAKRDAEVLSRFPDLYFPNGLKTRTNNKKSRSAATVVALLNEEINEKRDYVVNKLSEAELLKDITRRHLVKMVDNTVSKMEKGWNEDVENIIIQVGAITVESAAKPKTKKSPKAPKTKPEALPGSDLRSTSECRNEALKGAIKKDDEFLKVG